MKSFQVVLVVAFIQLATAVYPDYWSHDGMGTDITEIDHVDHVVKDVMEPAPCNKEVKQEVIYEKPMVAEHTPIREQQKVYLHRQPPIIVRPPPSKILVNHPPVVVKQPPVILHHHSRSPVIVKPVIIREKEVATKPVLFKVSQPKGKVWVSKCQKPEVHVSHTCNEGCNHGPVHGAYPITGPAVSDLDF
ncbi:Chorion S36/S38 [Sergentomyia squamirostris]